MTDEQIIKQAIKILIKNADAPCLDHHWGCPNCDMHRVATYLEIYLSLLDNDQ